jgi:type I restriction enzyme R subunit
VGLGEADTCRLHVTPAILSAGWNSREQVAEQYGITDGRVVIVGDRGRRRRRKIADYLLRYTADLPLAVVEAKAEDLPAGEGLGQAIEYAVMLGLRFAYATNGHVIIERDLHTGVQREIDNYPSPAELWERWASENEVDAGVMRVLRQPSYADSRRPERYYQTLAVNRTVKALASGQDRMLLNLATGTGKSMIAFQICWRLWNVGWTRDGRGSRPKILYLADRNILLDQPRLGVFAPFGDAMTRVGSEITTSRDLYFASYQQIAEDEASPGLYKDWPADFFDLIVVDECHRGSAASDSRWREILEYFTGAAKVGMTATPLREETRNTYAYFGTPLIEYSLARGIDDGFLAPYRVRRVVTDVDAAGWRPVPGQLDRVGNVIPDRQYDTRNFDRSLVLTQRTKQMARYLVEYLRQTGVDNKTLVFCVDQPHALAMRDAIAELVPDLLAQRPNWVARVTSDEGDIGRGALDTFQDVDSDEPVVLTTSEMLTTGVDAPTVRNVVLARWVNSLGTFKQIIGRGTRLRTDYGKWYFSIVDFTGTATAQFADPDFDGDPISEIVDHLTDEPPIIDPDDVGEPFTDAETDDGDGPTNARFYVDDAEVRIVADIVYELGPDGRRLTTTSITEYAADQVRTLYRSPSELRARWTQPAERDLILEQLADRGLTPDDLVRFTGHDEADPLDILCNLAFDTPLVPRAARARHVREEAEFLARFQPEARAILEVVLDKYAAYGPTELRLPDVLDTPPLSDMGTVVELAQRFGGPLALRTALADLQEHLYEETG